MRYLLMGFVLVAVSVPQHLQAETIADSSDDWSFEGIQGENNWFNGYYNLTVDQDDGDGVYQPADFIPFLNDDSLEVFEDGQNHWDGNVWRLYRDTAPDTGPWTTINQTGGHPNGLNSAAPFSVDEPVQEEHWPIRRWVSTYAGEASLISMLADTNTGCGTGTSVQLYHNGTLIDKLTTNTGGGVTNTVGANLAMGDIIDLALTPEGIDGNLDDPCDGSAFHLEVTDDPPPPPPTPAFADSFEDWSTTGTQGENNWFNGYYNLTQDDDGVYQSADFVPFTNSAGAAGGPVEPDGNHWDGNKWDLDSQGAPGPWTELLQAGTHPNGTNSAPNDEHWTIRRFVASDLPGPTAIELNWKMAKTNLNGDGVTGALFVNGEQVDTATIGGTDGTGVDRKFYVNANPGDVIDLALTPVGVTNDADGSDGSQNRLTIRTELPDGPLYNPGETVADSVKEFSGEQGQDGWFYGLYDQRLDAEEGDGVYSVDEFEAFLNDDSGFIWDDPPSWRESENHWNGNMWDIVDQAVVATGPWTQLGATNGHPAANAQGDPEVHWAIRRWVSDVEGEYNISGILNNVSTNGDGTVGRILLDGVEIWSEVSNGDIVDVDVLVDLAEGSILDFVIDPDGAGNYDPADPTTINNVADGSDGTTFSFTIGQQILFIPGNDPCDYNGDGVLDIADMDMLLGAVKAGANEARFDVNGDGLVDRDDIAVYAESPDKLNTYVGDSNFDGVFGSGDLVTVFTAGEYEDGIAMNSTWATGDWNGDGDFGSGDLVFAFTRGGYEVGPREGANAVPEPSSLVLLSFAGLWFLSLRRRS